MNKALIYKRIAGAKEYIIRTINSCETLEQLKNCGKLINNFVTLNIKETKNVLFDAEWLSGYLNGIIHARYGKDLTH